MQVQVQRSRWEEHAERRVGSEQLRRARMMGQAVAESPVAATAKTTLPAPGRSQDSGAS